MYPPGRVGLRDFTEDVVYEVDRTCTIGRWIRLNHEIRGVTSVLRRVLHAR